MNNIKLQYFLFDDTGSQLLESCGAVAKDIKERDKIIKSIIKQYLNKKCFAGLGLSIYDITNKVCLYNDETISLSKVIASSNNLSERYMSIRFSYIALLKYW